MKSLDKITKMDFIKIPSFSMDNFQTEIYNNLYLEFFFQNCRVLIDTNYDYVTTGEALAEEIASLEAILNLRKEALVKLRHFLIYNLSQYSALLETNSYYISQNGHLLIARFVPVEEDNQYYEVKLYTIPSSDLPGNYKDKIYIGRDIISMKTFRREHLGLKHMRNAIIDQFIKLKGRMKEFIPGQDFDEMQTEYLNEMEELVGEFAELSDSILKNFPVEISSETLEAEALTRANTIFREIKHMLIEMEESAREMEKNLFEMSHSRAVRYVTKFKKDIQNDINYILIKVNGRISDSINNIHL
ncbi:MAG: hypothetical protein OEZ34_11035 [Spirochaetia bacterium]|nr:hypothetical protein [Spirochaetia bacterium]